MNSLVIVSVQKEWTQKAWSEGLQGWAKAKTASSKSSPPSLWQYSPQSICSSPLYIWRISILYLVYECFGLVSIHRLGEAWRQNKQSPEIGNTQSGRSRTDLFSQSRIWQGISQYIREIHRWTSNINTQSGQFGTHPFWQCMLEEMDILEKVDINMNIQSCHLHRFKRTDLKDG